MKLYRICTENKNREQVEQAVGVLFDGFTVFEASGYWQGKQEPSLVLEIVSDPDRRRDVEMVTIAIRDFNKQECVLVQEFEVEARFI